MEEDLVGEHKPQDEVDAAVEGAEDDAVIASVTTRFQRKIMGYEEIVEEQKSDPELLELSKRLRKVKEVEEGRMTFFLSGGAVFAKDRKGRERLVVPRSAVRKILFDKHNLPQTGHPGKAKLLEELGEKLY